MSLTLSGLWVYPIKSLAGVAVDEAQVRPAGLRHDRRWMLVDDRGRFITRRTEHRLAQTSVTLAPGGYRVSVASGSVDVPEIHAGPRVPVQVWSSTVEAVDYPEGGQLLSRWLERPVRLVYLPDDVVRPAGDHAAPGDRVSFADAYPYLLIGEASLADLNARLPGPPVSMARFRPNLVVAGSEPFAEDRWSRLRVGTVRFRGVKRCDRCVMITLDPDTAEPGPEPMRTLATYRREHGKVWFGQNLVPDDGGALRVGSEIVPDEG